MRLIGIGDHLDAASDLTAILDLQAAAPRRSQNFSTGANNQAAARGQCPIDRAGNLGILYFDFTLEHAAWRDRKFGRVDHGGFDCAFHDKALCVLNDTLDADAPPDDKRPALGRIPRHRPA